MHKGTLIPFTDATGQYVWQKIDLYLHIAQSNVLTLISGYSSLSTPKKNNNTVHIVRILFFLIMKSVKYVFGIHHYFKYRAVMSFLQSNSDFIF